MRTTIVITVAAVMIVALLSPANGIAGASKAYDVRCVMTRMKDGKTIVTGKPALVVKSGQEGSFLAGGEAKLDQQPDGDAIDFGIALRVKVTDLGDDQVRLLARYSESDIVKQDAPGVVVRESALHVLRTIKLGEEVLVTLADGASMRMAVRERTMQKQ